MKSKSIKSKTKKTRKTRKNMINSKILKSVKKYTYKNKGGAAIFGKLASGVGKLAGKAALSVGKVAGKAALSVVKATGKVAGKAALSVGKAAAKKGAKIVSKVGKSATKKGAKPKKQYYQYRNKKTERYKNKKTNSLIMNNQSRNAKNNSGSNSNESNNKSSLDKIRKATYNKTSKSYLCEPTNFELILPPTHKSSPTVIGKKNMTYYKIHIPPSTEAGSRLRFKQPTLPIKNIEHNAGKNPPDCPPKQTLDSVNRLPTNILGITKKIYPR
jgi:hypothetical protein